MRSEAEVRAMIREIEAMPRVSGAYRDTRGAVIAVLLNVLDGPRGRTDCACMGPPDLCLCQIRSLGGGRYYEERG